MENGRRPLSLNRNQIKYIVIVAMLIDHIAWAFVPTASVFGQIMHFIGRLTGPTMAYFVVEGYLHTRNVRNYATRLGVFALISWLPYTFFEYGTLPIVIDDGRPLFIPAFGVIYTLFLSLMAVWFWDKAECRKWQKILGIIGFCALSIVGDWPVFDVLYAVFFFVFKDDKRGKWIGYCVVSSFTIFGALFYGEFFQLGVFLIPLLIEFCYNGEGGSRNPVHKWFFYIFYPAHLVVIAVLKMLL